MLVGSGYLHNLELVLCWLVCPCVSLLEVITCIPCALLVGVVGSWVVTCMPWNLCFLKGSINFIYTNN